MGNLSEHFDSSEFACRGASCCGHSHPMNVRLISGLELLRKAAGDRSLHINSGFRCVAYNGAIGSEDTSQHTLGNAADVRPPGDMKPMELYFIAQHIPEFAHGGLGVYDTFVHVDVRPDGPARWNKCSLG